jgi:hypothetical protein
VVWLSSTKTQSKWQCCLSSLNSFLSSAWILVLWLKLQKSVSSSSTNHRINHAPNLLKNSLLYWNLQFHSLRSHWSEDFNLHVDAPNTDAYADHFLTLIESFGFQKHVNWPTHNGDHILDLVLSRQSESLVKSIHVDDSLGRNISDHSAIKCMLNIRPSRWPTKTTTFRSFKSIDLEVFLLYIDSLSLLQSPAVTHTLHYRSTCSSSDENHCFSSFCSLEILWTPRS